MAVPAFKALYAAARQLRKRRQRLIRQQRQAMRRLRHAVSTAALRGYHCEAFGVGRQLPSHYGMRATMQHLNARDGSDHIKACAVARTWACFRNEAASQELLPGCPAGLSCT